MSYSILAYMIYYHIVTSFRYDMILYSNADELQDVCRGCAGRPRLLRAGWAQAQASTHDLLAALRGCSLAEAPLAIGTGLKGFTLAQQL